MRRFITLTMLAVFFSVTSIPPAYAQWWRFGPTSFDECVLAKMKGQAPGMIQYARKACREQFPEEEIFTEGPDYEASWCDTDKEDIVSACFTLKGNHKVVRAEALLSKQRCDDPNGEFAVKVSTDPPLIGSTYKFKVADAREFKCAVFNFFGHKRK